MINWVQFLQCPTPKICDAKKIVQKFARFLTTFDFNREYLRNGSTYQKSVYFGPQTTEFIPLINLHPNGFFSRDYISALRGCCVLKFLHVLEIHEGLLAHTPSGAGSPLKKILILKI